MGVKPIGKTKGQSLKAFVAHIDPVYRERLVRACQSLGFSVSASASHGIHAWKILQKKAPDFIIADWSLPEISGIGLLNLVRTDSCLCQIPFVLTAKKMTKEQVLEAGKAGVNEILVLPMPQEDLEVKLRQIFQEGQTGEAKQAQILYNRGVALMQEGRYEDAIQQFSEILTVYEHAEVYYNLGYIKTAQAQYQEAINFFRKATQINKAFASAYRMMAKCYEKLDQVDTASECYQQAADIFMERDMDEDAEKALEELLRLKPETINVYNSLGILYRKRGAYKEAAAQYRKALKVNPNDENIYYNLARMYFETGDYFMAKQALEEALELNPKFSAASDLHSVVETKLKDMPPPLVETPPA
jgi:tetratricopeptide (TPR) repeat protein